MVRTLDDYVEKVISHEEKLQIVRDHIEMEKNNGKIGETVLRSFTEMWMVENGIGSYNFPFTAELLTTRVWKYFAMLQIKEKL